MSYEEFLDYIKDNLADCYKGIMVSEEVDKVKTDALSDDEEVDKLYFNSRREVEKKYEGCEVFLRKVVKNNGIVLDAVGEGASVEICQDVLNVEVGSSSEAGSKEEF